MAVEFDEALLEAIEQARARLRRQG